VLSIPIVAIKRSTTKTDRFPYDNTWMRADRVNRKVALPLSFDVAHSLGLFEIA
jgi:hypothetical protein